MLQIQELQLLLVDLPQVPAAENVIHAGHHQQGHQRGVQQTADAHQGHRLHQGRAYVLAEGHDHQAQDRGQGRHENGPQAGDAGLDDGLPAAHTLQPQLVDVVHQDNAVVDDDAHQHHKAHQRHHADLDARQQQGQEAAGEGQGNGEHDD